LDELQQHQTEMRDACHRAMAGAQHDLDFIRIDTEAFAASPANSIDYAVMEQTQDAAMVQLDAGWSDLGAWAALSDVLEQDTDGNCIKGDVLTDNVQDSLIHANSRLVAAIGVHDLVVVETEDAVL